jgi:Flp pilus assembly protein TadD
MPGVDALQQRLAVAQAWWMLGQRSQDTVYLDRADQMLDETLNRDDLTAEAWVLAGVIHESRERWDRAEQAYLKAIELDAKQPAALNNAAMVIARDPGRATLAIEKAQAVVQAYPGNPNFLDTLAHVQSVAGQHEAAEQTIRRAIRLDPSNPQWQLRLQEITQRRSNATTAEVQ